ncbi:restriction endonuclease subunit S [Thalassolituus maritimus]|uniref:Restriction endonuclease subunit S n=1 Tax=Thalassolituus maritimus TaxID=484498 RepID=A0ABP9ZWG1_9GAMM
MGDNSHSGTPDRRSGGNLLPEGWCQSTIGELAEVNPKKIDADLGLKAGFVPMALAPVNFLDSLEHEEKTWGEIKKSYTNFQDNDVIFAKVTPCFENGKAAIVRNLPNAIGAGSSEFYVLRVHKSLISEKLIFAVVKTFDFLQQGVENMTGAVGLRRVPRAFVEAFPVPLPPLAEQKIIAEKLDTLLAQVDTIKARLERIPDIIKRFRQSVLATAVSGKLTEEWREANSGHYSPKLNEKYDIDDKYTYDIPINWILTAIGNCSSFQQGLQIAKNTRTNEPGDGVLPILRTVNYENGFQHDVHYASFDSKTIIAEPEDVVISRTGTVGRVLTGYKGIIHNNSFRLNYQKSLLNREYLIFFLQSPICQLYVQENSGRSTQPDLTHKAFSRCPLSLPPKNEQTEIVRRVEELFAFADTIEQKAAAALERVNNLTQSILAKAFRGELTADWRAANPELISGDNSAEALLAKIQAEREALALEKKAAKKTRKKKA